MALLAGCGSAATTNTNAAKTEAVEAGLRDLQQRLNAFERSYLHRGKVETLSLAPPKGVSAAEWEAAVRSDPAIPAAVRALVSSAAAGSRTPLSRSATTQVRSSGAAFSVSEANAATTRAAH
jgi:hypothetical protein